MSEFKYRAFISYSHADERWGGWLHRTLENYRVPKGLVGLKTDVGVTPRRIAPIFRDRDDLPAAGNLNAEIQAALAASQFQVVLCSPNAAKSKWVNEEIKLFKKLHGPDRTLAIVIDGEPWASKIAGREDEECFPPALRFRVDENGEITNEPAEPIAADARKAGDGRSSAVTKLVAGLIGVKLDDLVQREAIRRAKRARYIAGGATVVAASMGLLTVAAVNSEKKAVKMHGKAENLIEFMLTDLSGKLEPYGRLDALDAVGERALTYYADQNERELDADALSRRARALLLVGDVDQRRNDLAAALKAYETAAAATAELLRREPNNPQRIFDHAQSIFYVGDIAAARGDLFTAEAQFNEYLRLAERLVEIDPADPKWRLELAYATSNLGGLKFKAGDYDQAIPFFEQSVAARKALFEAAPDDQRVAMAYAYALSWQALGELARGGFALAVELIEKQLQVYAHFHTNDGDDFTILDALVTAQRRLAEAKLGLGDLAAARQTINQSMKTADQLLARDKDNANWKLNASYILQAKSFLNKIDGDQQNAIAEAQAALALSREVHLSDQSDLNAQVALGYSLARRLEAGGPTSDLAEMANELSIMLSKAVQAGDQRRAGMIGDAALALARFETSQGRQERAREYAAAGAEELNKYSDKLEARGRLSLAALYYEAGAINDAAGIAASLEALDMAHPEFTELQRRLKTAG